MTIEQLENLFKAFAEEYQGLFDTFVDDFWTLISSNGGENIWDSH